MNVLQKKYEKILTFKIKALPLHSIFSNLPF